MLTEGKSKGCMKPRASGKKPILSPNGPPSPKLLVEVKAANNSDYAAVLRVWQEWLEAPENEDEYSDMIDWVRDRLKAIGTSHNCT